MTTATSMASTRVRRTLTKSAETDIQPLGEGPLVSDLVSAYRRSIEVFRNKIKLSVEESIEKADELNLDYVLNCEPEHLSWGRLQQLQNHDPDLAMQRWSEINRAAREELQTGNRAS